MPLEQKIASCCAQVAEAVEDMRRYGASLVRPVAEAMEATRAQGAVALERGVLVLDLKYYPSWGLGARIDVLAWHQQSVGQSYHLPGEVQKLPARHGVMAMQLFARAWRLRRCDLERALAYVTALCVMTGAAQSGCSSSAERS